MAAEIYTTQNTESFNSIWSVFVRNFAVLTKKRALSREDEEGLMSLAEGVIERYRVISESCGRVALPESMHKFIIRLKQISRFSALSDKEYWRFARRLKVADRSIQTWRGKIRRSRVWASHAKQHWFFGRFMLYVVAPTLFVGLVYVFVVAIMQIFLSR